MSNYTPSTNFAAKDALVSGNPAKIVKGTEISAEFSAIQAAISSKYDSSTVVPVAAGGTGSTTAATARSALGAAASGANTDITSVGAITGVTASTGDNTTKLATTEFVSTALTSSVPSGTVITVAMSSAPTGYLKCNGAAVSRTTYAALFTAISTSFGVGDGSTTFNLPDLRGEFVRGWDDGKGTDSGRTFASSQTDAFQGHYHDLWGSAAEGYGIGGADNLQSPVGSLSTSAVRDALTDGTHGTPRTASETRPRNIALLYCIKY